MDQRIGIQQLRRAIPRRCFQPGNFRSSRFVLFDLALAISLAWLASTISPYLHHSIYKWGFWVVYGYVQGLIFTGIWIIAHECGHGALFTTKAANDSVGFVLHSALLVPYFSWKYTHARHHRYTNNIDKDTAFVPRREGEEPGWLKLIQRLGPLEDTPVYAACSLVLHQTLGWPVYLFSYASGASVKTTRGRLSSVRRSHFDPTGDLFVASEQLFVLLSTIGVCITIFCLVCLAQASSSTNVLLLYGVPYLWVNNWLIAITYLHHNDENVYHYESSKWTFLDGATSTVDRPFGFIGHHLFHGIIDYHVVHHLFPRIPFYHAEEATKAIIPLLGDAYHKDPTPFWLALWRTFRSCRAVEACVAQPGVLRWTHLRTKDI